MPALYADGVVVLSPGVCARLAGALERALLDAQQAGATVDGEVLEAVRAVRLLADRHISTCGNFRPLKGKSSDDEPMTAKAAADELGLHPRRVRQLAETLGGWQDDGGRWWFDRAAVEEYRACREAS